MKLRDIMTTDLRRASPSSNLVEVARLMQEPNVGSIPVCEGDRLLGIITDRDIAVRCVAEGHNPSQCKATDYMSRDLVTATPDMSQQEALDLMGREQIRRLPVVENGRLVGIVSLGDLAVETQGERKVAESLTQISEPIHQTEGGQPKKAA